MKRALIVDCFDSFTYNIHHYIDSILDGHCDVIRYDKFVNSVLDNYSHVVLSPGPGLPEHYPKLNDLINSFPDDKSLLGICLGMQSICTAFGGRLNQLDSVKHGVDSQISHDYTSILYQSIPEVFNIGHYHSWVVSEDSMPHDFNITARNEDGLIMSFQHQNRKIFGVQYHPESVLTEFGHKILKNWIELS